MDIRWQEEGEKQQDGGVDEDAKLRVIERGCLLPSIYFSKTRMMPFARRSWSSSKLA
jgi:hypothetical protein